MRCILFTLLNLVNSGTYSTSTDEFSRPYQRAGEPATLRMAAERRDCSGLAEYLLDLAKAFNRFYRECPVLAAETPELAGARLALAEAVRRIISDGLGTLTIGVPEAM